MKKQRKNKNDIVTKTYLDKVLDERFDRFKLYFDFRFERIEQMAEEFLKYKSFMLDKLDWLVGKYKKFDEEYTIISGKSIDISKTLEDHETRITTLETKTN